MPQPQMSPDSATRAVYANLFGCPAQFASIAEVLPDSQGPAGDDNATPLTEVDNGNTPATMSASSAYTDRSEQEKGTLGGDTTLLEQVRMLCCFILLCATRCSLLTRSIHLHHASRLHDD